MKISQEKSIFSKNDYSENRTQEKSKFIYFIIKEKHHFEVNKSAQLSQNLIK